MFSQMYVNPHHNYYYHSNFLIPSKNISKTQYHYFSNMDSFQSKKLQVSMNSYNKTQFLHNLILSSMVAITCSFLCSYPFWFSSLTTSIKHFVFISLPTICSSFLNPKCLFIVFNVIVAFLVGESKFVGSSSQQSSPATDIYSEYVERSQSLHGQKRIISSTIHEEKEELVKMEIMDEEERVYEDKEVVVLDQVEDDKEEKHDGDDDQKLKDDDEATEKFEEAENNDDEGEVSDGLLPTEELNRRVEEFIARVNKQRWLEAKMMICCQA
ncbi:uncharacterized protein LOC133821033 [Humulus lupulus]|uniref:uncharacterized protein LOC133821033 n=1 Tax=Humulus lupulus TaxID=3486 RepID=UPI002B404BCB|nr:uncharacterized protein LOC133821033 [Humulus lupulus]